MRYLLFLFLLCGSCLLSADSDCETVVTAVNRRAQECNAHFILEGDCKKANVGGDVQGCLEALRDANCEDLRGVVRAKCLDLFKYVGF